MCGYTASCIACQVRMTRTNNVIMLVRQMRSLLVPVGVRMSYFTGNEEKFAIVRKSLTRSFVDEIFHIVIGVIQSVVIFMLA